MHASDWPFSATAKAYPARSDTGQTFVILTGSSISNQDHYSLMSTSIADMRKEYSRQSLEVSDVNADPVVQFQRWFDEATRSELPEPNAMHLSTVTREGKAAGRIVLLKGIEDGAFVFYTNYQSRKGQQMKQAPWVSLTFFWAELERQVRIEGSVDKLPAEQSTAYFHSRPRGSQIGAWVSPQSEVIPDRTFLVNRLEELEKQFEGQEVPRPEHWGGYAVRAEMVEFWQGRPNRLHDRIRYSQGAEGQWIIERLAP
jgi:pyridoxamine 5'-phosphate oxidase